MMVVEDTNVGDVRTRVDIIFIGQVEKLEKSPKLNLVVHKTYMTVLIILYSN